MTTATLIQARPERAQITRKGPGHPRRTTTQRVQLEEIEGRFRPISTMQLLMAYSVCRQHSRTGGWRQLRIYFAAHEMAERRRWAKKENPDWRPLYELEELQKLVGEGSATQLAADIRKLNRLGLVTIEKHKISFATSIEQIAVDDVSDFWSMWAQVENKNRSVPMPRRTLRALAAGFTPAVTATMLALLIRSVFWHKKDGCYSIDGRTKRSWIADVFAISQRSVTDARAHLIDIGWLMPQQAPQWLINKHGSYDVINVDWSPNAKEENAPTSAVGERRSACKSASPSARFDRKSASPDLTGLLSLTRELKNQKAQGRAPDPAGFSCEASKRRTQPASAPNIRDITSADFGNTERLLELQRQATTIGLWQRGEGSQLEFLAMAEHAWNKGERFGALFMALLQKQRFAFITNGDEDRARKRLREHRDEEFGQTSSQEEGTRSIQDLIQPRRMPGTSKHESRLSPEGEFVEKCIRVARQAGLQETRWWQVAQQIKQWTCEQWEAAYCHYQLEQVRHWHSDEIEAYA